jgi:glycosyltransferase involved in cell wall biosynthesis
MRVDHPVRVVYCEGNVDGTIGGSYYSLLYLVKGLDRRRYEPLVIFHAETGLLGRFHEAGVETLVWPRLVPATFAGRLSRGWGPIRSVLLVVQKAVNFVRGFLWPAVAQAIFLRRRGARIVHLNNSVVCNHDWMLAARLAGLACVTHERGINDDYPSAARYWAQRLDAVLCISDAVRRQLEAHGLDNGNLITIHNAFDPAESKFRQSASELRAAHGIPADAPVLVMTGNLKAWKGQEAVIRAMAQVSRTHPKARCLLVGATSRLDLDFEARMRALVSELGLQEHVLFVGFRENVADYMRMADVVIHASVLPEPFGRVALEAMACRKPVIGSDAGGIPEIVQDGSTGFTFPPGDTNRLAEKVNWMLDHPEEAARMGERGYTRLVEHFPISANVRATEHVYERVLAGAATRGDRLNLAREDTNVE